METFVLPSAPFDKNSKSATATKLSFTSILVMLVPESSMVFVVVKEQKENE
eukprot:CAMPEP_0172748202 /NCGR_PEP_ID=MMETSP1074-20121228/144544_1 /TAXON_ID=2916 /ORGANISM="Ceratium fusus, Strain PA161109" /LENGTH=50 /DNA_ID=CAMNT_0013579909 /DNA_START=84 /DNA_END=233 /DNA_ORIENTATION=+